MLSIINLRRKVLRLVIHVTRGLRGVAESDLDHGHVPVESDISGDLAGDGEHVQEACTHETLLVGREFEQMFVGASHLDNEPASSILRAGNCGVEVQFFGLVGPYDLAGPALLECAQKDVAWAVGYTSYRAKPFLGRQAGLRHLNTHDSKVRRHKRELAFR